MVKAADTLVSECMKMDNKIFHKNISEFFFLNHVACDISSFLHVLVTFPFF